MFEILCEIIFIQNGGLRAEVMQPKSPMIFVVPNSGQKPQVGGDESKIVFIPDLIWERN